jgi:hypothetical protein
MSLRSRVFALVAVVVLVASGATVYVLVSRQELAEAVAGAPPVPVVSDPTTVTGGPRIVFRSTAIGNQYGLVAQVPLADPGGPRLFTTASCERVYATGTAAVCLSANRGLVTTYTAEVLGPDWRSRQSLPLSGVPSRARLSRDAGMVATTTFVAGHDYSRPGTFSTQTLVTAVGTRRTVDIEEFALIVDGSRVTAADRNLWGVTFRDNDRFYATAASGGRTWLVEGSVSARRLVALREDAECPSLSPDGTRVAVKTRGGLPPGRWRIAVYDLARRTTTMLAELRSVDDQIEWLDDSRVVYGLPQAGTGPTTSDVWEVPADGTGAPRLLIRDAWSPAVIR